MGGDSRMKTQREAEIRDQGEREGDRHRLRERERMRI